MHQVPVAGLTRSGRELAHWRDDDAVLKPQRADIDVRKQVPHDVPTYSSKLS